MRFGRHVDAARNRYGQPGQQPDGEPDVGCRAVSGAAPAATYRGHNTARISVSSRVAVPSTTEEEE